MSISLRNNLADAKSPSESTVFDEYGEARLLFPVESLQRLDRESALRCQALIGHGDCYGVWKTPEALCGGQLEKHLLSFDVRKRLMDFLPQDLPFSVALEELLSEAVLWITRYALLLRLGPAGMQAAKGRPLSATTVIGRVYQTLPRILGLAIVRRIEAADDNAIGFMSFLNSDLNGATWRREHYDELKRIERLAEMGLWNDAPLKVDIKKATNPKGDALVKRPQFKSIPFPPIPDDYLAEMGPRVLWLVLDLGPNLLQLFESIPQLFCDINFKPGVQKVADKNSGAIKLRLRKYFLNNSWLDRSGGLIEAPPFRFKIGAGRRATFGTDIDDPFAWPPRTWEDVRILSVTLQSAHLWIALLAMAGRIGEVASLKRDCVQWARDGEVYVNGKTYKLSENHSGVERQWPAPDVLVQALAQQVRLVLAWERITRFVKCVEIDMQQDVEPDHLWASLGAAWTSDPEAKLVLYGKALQQLAVRIGVSPRPGGKALHPHRFRKTIARLAGIAIVESPRVLMKLLGHKDIAMTLHYILTDKALQVEIETVARELRIMRCQGLVEDIRAALHTPESSKYGGYGGGGASVLAAAVAMHEEDLHRNGRLWNAESSYELATILTGNGQYFRVTRPGVLCIKESKEAGPCVCDSTCINRIEEKTIRRDVREVIPVLIADGKRALDGKQLLLVADMVQQIDEDLARFDDINAEFCDHPDLVELRRAVA